jgi:hypothetical protein
LIITGNVKEVSVDLMAGDELRNVENQSERFPDPKAHEKEERNGVERRQTIKALRHQHIRQILLAPNMRVIDAGDEKGREGNHKRQRPAHCKHRRLSIIMLTAD